MVKSHDTHECLLSLYHYKTLASSNYTNVNPKTVRLGGLFGAQVLRRGSFTLKNAEKKNT